MFFYFSFCIRYLNPGYMHEAFVYFQLICGTSRLLAAWEVCAHRHFIFSILGMNSSFENVVLVSPDILWKKINKKLFLYGRFSMMSNAIYEKINVEDNNFANIFRMDTNSVYVFFSKSAESNTSIFPSFGCNIIAIQ